MEALYEFSVNIIIIIIISLSLGSLLFQSQSLQRDAVEPPLKETELLCVDRETSLSSSSLDTGELD